MPEAGIGVTKPVALWLREVEFDAKPFFVALAKAAVKGVAGKVDDTLVEFGDALAAAGLGKEPGQVAFTLLYGSLTRAIAELIKDAADFLPSLEAPPTDSDVEAICARLDEKLQATQVRIEASFFERPQGLPFLDEFQPILMDWLRELGLPKAEARALADRLPHKFPLALHEEWRKKPQHYGVIEQAMDSPFLRAEQKERNWLAYEASLRAQVHTRMFAEAFGLAAVYVPLLAYYEKSEGSDPSMDNRQSKQKHRVVVDLHAELADWVGNGNGDPVRVVSGGPGSGKSSFARMFAVEVVEKLGVRVLFVPLHLFDPKADLIQGVADFVAGERHLDGNPLDAKAGQNRLVVIFDGLDELAMQGKAALEVAREFVDEVLRQAARFSADGLQRQFLITGRDLAVQATLAKLRGARQHLQILPYFTPEEERHAYHDPEGLLAKDRRHDWWARYDAASGKGFRCLPAELNRDNLMDITRQPLLNYLVALSHGRGKLDFSKATTLNEIYADLLAAVHERQWEGGRRHVGSGDLEEDQFVRILEEIALAIWHGDGRTTTVDAIRARCERGRLTKYLEQFTEGAKQGVTRLLTAFYFRQAGDIRGERTFEFTHKSFGEYLTARRLVRALTRIETMSARHDEDPDDGWDERDALQHWAEIAGPTAMDEYLYEFVQREVALRGEKQCRVWQGTLCRLIAWASHPEKGMPMEKLDMRSFAEMLRQSRNAEEALLALHGACADQTKDVMEIHWHSPTAFGAWFKRLQGQRDGSQNTLAQSCLGYLHLAGCRLDFMDLYEARLIRADLRRAQLIGAALFNAQCRETNFGRANLSRADLRGAELSRASLLKADLSEADLRESNLRMADLRGADLRGAELSRASFLKADLSESDLRDADLGGADLGGADLAYAQFVDADLEGADLEGADLDNGNLRMSI